MGLGGLGEAGEGEDGCGEEKEGQPPGLVGGGRVVGEGAEVLAGEGECGEEGASAEDIDGVLGGGLGLEFGAEAEGDGGSEGEEEEGEDEIDPGDTGDGRVELHGGGRDLGVIHPGGEAAPGEHSAESHAEDGDSSEGVEAVDAGGDGWTMADGGLGMPGLAGWGAGWGCGEASGVGIDSWAGIDVFLSQVLVSLSSQRNLGHIWMTRLCPFIMPFYFPGEAPFFGIQSDDWSSGDLNRIARNIIFLRSLDRPVWRCAVIHLAKDWK